jgi:putative redox protein
MTILLYVRRKGWTIRSLTVECSHRRIYRSPDEGAVEEIRSRVLIEGDITDEQKDRITSIAARCPVHRTLQARPAIVNEVVVIDRSPPFASSPRED